MIRLTINTDNDAFGNNPRTELSRIFRQLASVFEEHGLPNYARPVLDVNGNRVGMLVFEEPSCGEYGHECHHCTECNKT